MIVILGSLDSQEIHTFKQLCLTPQQLVPVLTRVVTCRSTKPIIYASLIN